MIFDTGGSRKIAVTGLESWKVGEFFSRKERKGSQRLETRNQKLTNQQAKPFAAVAHCAAYMVLRVKHTINDRKERSNGKNFCISRYGVLYVYPLRA